jgi:HPt (histidine-containing phosphotransfer) domain-containing protein
VNPPAAAGAGDGLLDMGVIRELGVLEHSPDDRFLTDLLETFAQDAHLAIERMRACASAGDIATLAREAHRMKGCSGSLGALPFAGACVDIERNARTRATTEIAECIDRAAQVLDATHERIRQFVQAAARDARG